MTVWRCPHCRKVIYRKETVEQVVTLERRNAATTGVLDWSNVVSSDCDLGLPPPINKEVPDDDTGR